MKRLSGKVILIDDQPVEKEILEIALEKLNVYVDLIYFTSAIEAFKYLKKTKDNIFIIICDMDMPKMNGLDLKRAIDADDHLKTKAVPFIF
jgi:CheY-like chemotaxis protein